MKQIFSIIALGVAFTIHLDAAVITTALTEPLSLHDDFFGSYEAIDMDANGTVDFTIGYDGSFVGLRTETTNRVIFVPDPPPNLGGAVASLSYPFAIQADIDGIDHAWRSSDLSGGYVSSGENAFATIVIVLYPGSETRFSGRGAIGVEFLSSSGTNYGYLDVEAGAGYAGITLYGWAYESEPGVGITATQVPEPSQSLLLALGCTFLLTCRRRKRRL